MAGEHDATPAQAVDALVDEYRQRCLWFLREDYYPHTDAERLKVLDDIQRHGDREAFQRTGEARRWFSLNSSERSAVSWPGHLSTSLLRRPIWLPWRRFSGRAACDVVHDYASASRPFESPP